MSESSVNAYKAEFLKICREKIRRDGLEDVLDWLQKSDFFAAPASTRFHGNHEGGLVEHSLNVYRNLLILNNAFQAGLAEESMAIAALFHDVCKVGVYQAEVKNRKTYDPEKVNAADRYRVKHDIGGDFVWEAVSGYSFQDSCPLGHGEKSAILIQSRMKLKKDELLAIVWHMGGFDIKFQGGDRGLSTAFEMCPLAVLLHLADVAASYLQESRMEVSGRNV